MTITEAERLVRELAETAKAHRVHEVERDEAAAMLVVLHELVRLRDLLADVERSAAAALVTWGSPTVAHGYVSIIDDQIRAAMPVPRASGTGTEDGR
jgi:hypothetical protein